MVQVSINGIQGLNMKEIFETISETVREKNIIKKEKSWKVTLKKVKYMDIFFIIIKMEVIIMDNIVMD